MPAALNSLKTRKTLKVGTRSYDYFSLKAAEKTLGDLKTLPNSMKVLLENLLRYEDGRTVTIEDIRAIGAWLKQRKSDREIAYRPARVLMQDFTGVPAVVDLAAMREAMVKLGGDPTKINPLSPVDLVIDHSVMVDFFAGPGAFKKNVELEYERNGERYAFLRWGSTAFDNFRVVPPGTGICHQVNLENLSQVVWTAKEKEAPKGKRQATIAYPDTLVGTDSHTTMVNGMAVLGWGVGGIEAEAAMLGQPVSMLIPEVVGFKLMGKLREGATATDLVLTVTQMLRKKGVVGKFVEFYGAGLDDLPLADRATIANMAPEYGATCGFFPVDAETIRFLKATGRKADRIALVEKYAKAQGMWRDKKTPDPVFTDSLSLDLDTVEPSLAGPKRPQDRVPLSQVATSFKSALTDTFGRKGNESMVSVRGADYELGDGAVVIAAITSCTNTSNPSVMLGAGLLARNAVAKGLKTKPWVKTSLAPGSQVVTDYLKNAGVNTALDKLGFNLVGYGCTTCIGNSGPVPDPIADAIAKGDLVAGAVLSGNRNFEGRVNPACKANYLASPMLVVAYAIAGSLKVDITKDPLGYDKKGQPIYLKDIWPSSKEIADAVAKFVKPSDFKKRYADVFKGDANWRKVKTTKGMTYGWDAKSTYVANPPYFTHLTKEVGAAAGDITGARPLAILGDSITTDHISPAGSIKKDGPAGQYLIKHGVDTKDFNSYGARRGNHEVMMRGTFANIRLKNEMVPGTEGGITKLQPSGEVMSIYDASMKYQAQKVPLVIIAGKEYGTGSSRDWAAKGTVLLGVKAVITESFERIHRSNLVGMGVLPLQFQGDMTRKSLNLDGTETFDLTGIAGGIKPRMDVKVKLRRANGQTQDFTVTCRIDTADEVEYFKNGGILPYVLRSLAKSAAA
ncbi:aconitate hydratase AcnA [Dongia sp.]|uniref:aconitate hydratase AcnA n=1 Tax=Dongia sp. TaxID=1977262 RepID=UPI0037531231